MGASARRGDEGSDKIMGELAARLTAVGAGKLRKPLFVIEAPAKTHLMVYEMGALDTAVSVLERVT